MAGHPAGVLAIDHRALCSLRRAEDATAHADRQRLDERDPGPDAEILGMTLMRPATDSERTLLGALGYGTSDQLRTHVERVTAAVLRRTWPGLTTASIEPVSTPIDTAMPTLAWTNAQIRDWAAERDIDLDGAVTKADMLAVIANHM